MPATVTQLPVRAEQPAPSEADQAACFTKLMWDAAVMEGERRVYARLGIPQPVPVQSRRLSVLGPVS